MWSLLVIKCEICYGNLLICRSCMFHCYLCNSWEYYIGCKQMDVFIFVHSRYNVSLDIYIKIVSSYFGQWVSPQHFYDKCFTGTTCFVFQSQFGRWWKSQSKMRQLSKSLNIFWYCNHYKFDLSEFIFWLYLIHYKIVDFHYIFCMLSLVRIPTDTHSKKILLYTK